MSHNLLLVDVKGMGPRRQLLKAMSVKCLVWWPMRTVTTQQKTALVTLVGKADSSTI